MISKDKITKLFIKKYNILIKENSFLITKHQVFTYLNQDLSTSQNNRHNFQYRNLQRIMIQIKSSLSHILSEGNKQSKKLNKLIAQLHGPILLSWNGWSLHIMWDTNFEAVKGKEITIFDIIFYHIWNKMYNGFSFTHIENFYSFEYFCWWSQINTLNFIEDYFFYFVSDKDPHNHSKLYCHVFYLNRSM